jgi:hypothetical protein
MPKRTIWPRFVAKESHKQAGSWNVLDQKRVALIVMDRTAEDATRIAEIYNKKYAPKKPSVKT